MEDLRNALRRLAKAVVVITAKQDGKRYAMAATAVSELSFDPPSMLIIVNKSASIHSALAAGAPFAINILHYSQQDIAEHCSGAIKGEARFERGRWTTGMSVPCLVGAQASIVCRNATSTTYGTHSIFIGDVQQVLIEGIPEPLIYLDGRYSR